MIFAMKFSLSIFFLIWTSRSTVWYFNQYNAKTISFLCQCIHPTIVWKCCLISKEWKSSRPSFIDPCSLFTLAFLLPTCVSRKQALSTQESVCSALPLSRSIFEKYALEVFSRRIIQKYFLQVFSRSIFQKYLWWYHCEIEKKRER